MERMTLSAEYRPPISKGERNRLRAHDKVLAVLYGRGKETIPLVVDGRSLRHVLSTGGSNVLMNLEIKQPGKKNINETVMFKDIQRHMMVKDRIMHVDFIRISMTDKIEVAVQLLFTGEPAGVKQGGVLQILMREVQVRCLPAAIPEHFEVDLSDLNIGDSISTGSLDMEEGVELITDPDEPLAQVLAPTAIEEEEPEEVAEPDQQEKEEQVEETAEE